MPQLDAASSLHETMLEMVHEARRRGMPHDRYPLGACESLLKVHAPAGESVGSICEGCLERWPCHTVLAILGGLGRTPGPRARRRARRPSGPGRSA
ncbi:hypothetical protein [Sinomonas atrocyanea]|uniref:hypothetical protein n=1 Tax=Sinomonas atrocyanea TaxID=37927 RepID=UPI0012ED5C16|nr:hypothetical protein [Sinomonas atrocyanea]